MKRFAWTLALALTISGLLLWALRAELGAQLSEPLLATLALLVVAAGLGAGAVAQRLVTGILCAGLGAWLGLSMGVAMADLMEMGKGHYFARAALVWMAAGGVTTLSLCVGTLSLARSKWAVILGLICVPVVLMLSVLIGTMLDRYAASVLVPCGLMALEAAGLVVAAVLRRRSRAADGGSE